MASFRSWTEVAPKQAARQPSRRDEEDRYWRRRDEEQRRQQDTEKKAKEDVARKAMDVASETSYPSLGGPRPKATGLGKNQFASLENMPTTKPKPINTFAKLATQWKQEDEETSEKERLRRAQNRQERVGSEGVFVYRRRVEGDDYQEPEEEDHRPRDTSGWSEVSHNKYKPKYEMSADEMDQMCDDMEEKEDEYGVNEHLFEVSHRHDHH